MKFEFGYSLKMCIGGSFTKCKSEIPILIHVFPILLNEKVLQFLFFSRLLPQTKSIMGLKKSDKLFGTIFM